MAKKKAPSRTSTRGAQGKSRMSGRTKTARGTNRGQKQQPQAQSAKEAPQRRAARGASATRGKPQTRSSRRQTQQSQSPVRNKTSQAKGRTGSASRAKSAKASRGAQAQLQAGAQSGSRAPTKTEGRPRKQNQPYRAEGDRKKGERGAASSRQRWDEGEGRQMEMSRPGAEGRRGRDDRDTGRGARARTERSERGRDQGQSQQRAQAPDEGGERTRGDSKRRRGPTGTRREIQGGMHAEEQGIQQAQGRWRNEEDMTPSPRRHKQQQSENTGEAQRQMGGDEGPMRDGHDRGAAMEDLDAARRHTDVRDEGEDEGYGRSEGSANRRLSQRGEYPADDDDQQYGRNLGGRNRVPGGGSRRNQ
ncbi:MAG: hypothetical protein AB7E79_02380 [Rhodospirillaceae bacterium]